jgi:type II secretion system protein D
MKKTIFFLCWILCLPLFAQNEQNTESGNAAQIDESARIVCAPVGGLDPNENVAPVALNNMPVPQAIQLLQRLSGRTLLVGAGVPNARLNFSSGDEITRIDAIYAIENLLAMHGVHLVKIDDQFVSVTSSVNVTRGGPVLLTQELSPELRGGQVYARLFPLKYLAAQEANGVVAPLLTAGRGQSAVLAFVRSNSLLVIDTLTNLQFIQSVLKDVDKPGNNRMEVYSLPLANTPVRNAFQFITQLQRTSHEDVLRGSTFYQDNRTNQLIVSTSPAHIDLIRRIVEDFDRDVAPLTTSRIFQIRYANVASVNSILNGIVNNQRRIWSQQGFAQSGAVSVSGKKDEEVKGAAAGVTVEVENVQEGPTVVPSADGAAQYEGSMMSIGMPQLQFSPYLAIFMDRNSSQIIAYGTKGDLDRLGALIESLDKETAPFTESEMIHVKYADTYQVTDTITRLINSQRWAFNREGVSAAVRREDEPASSIDPETEGLKFSQFAVVVAERRANAILAFGTQSDLARIKRLVSQLDTEVAPLTESKMFYFRFADANTASSIISRIIQNQRSTFGREGVLDVQRRGDEGAAVDGADATGGLVFSPYVTFMADRRSNSLLVYGTKNDIVRVGELIASIDVEAAPFTQSQVVYLKHSQASTIGTILSNLINQQRRSFAQAGLRATGETRQSAESGPLVRDETGTEFSSFASVVPDQRINALLLYGTRSDIQSLEAVIKSMDIPVDPLTRSEVFQLRYAQSTTLVGILNNIIRGQQQALQRVSSISRQIRSPGGDAEPSMVSGAGESMQFSPYVTLVADRRSNTILGYGTVADLNQIRELIEKTDIEVAPITRSQVFQIQHGESNQVVQTLQTLISSQQRVREQEATLRRVFARGEEGNAEAVETGQASDRLTDMVVDGDEGFQFSPYISLVSDQRSNSVVAYGTSFDLEQVSDLIKRIDVVLPQVRIEVVIAEVALTGDMVSGLSAFGFQYKNPLDPANPGIGDYGFQMGAPAFDGGGDKAFSTSFTLKEFSLNTIFNVAQRDRNVRVLSAPTIVTTHNRQAQINVGQARPIVTGTITGAGTGADLTTRATVEYRDIGIELRVRPLIGTGSNIQMEIEQIVDTVVGTQTISDNVQPIIGTRRASSFISVRDQEVIVLGGLQSVDTADVNEKVFLLGDLPLLGGLFRPKTTRQDVRELIIFIKPYIVESGSDRDRMAKEQLEKTAVGREIEYYLREGRFPEQEQLRSGDKTKDDWQPASAPQTSQRVWELPKELPSEPATTGVQ